MFALKKNTVREGFVNICFSYLKKLYLKSNFVTVNLNYETNNEKRTNKKIYKKSKAQSLFDKGLNIHDKLILFKNLPKYKCAKYECISAKEVYKYLLDEYKKCFNYISLCDIIQSVKIFDELDKTFTDYNFYIEVKNIDKNVLNKINEIYFKNKDITFHRREILGKICNKIMSYIHEMNGNELIHFLIYFFRWNKNDKNLILFYNYYFNYVFDHMYLFNHEIYKLLFIFNKYLNNNSNIPFNKNLIQEMEFNLYYFREIKNEKNYIIKMNKKEIYKKCFAKFHENVDHIDNEKILNILRLYVDNSILDIDINNKMLCNLNNNLINENIEYISKLLNFYCTLIKKGKYDNDMTIYKLKEVIKATHHILCDKTKNLETFCSDIDYSTLLNSLNNKFILNKIIDKNFILFYECLLKILLNIKFVNFQSLCISLISLKNIYYNILRNNVYIVNNVLFNDIMKFSLYLCNIFLGKRIKTENENAVLIIHNNDQTNYSNKENIKDIIIQKRIKEYIFYKMENYKDFHFKLKDSDLLSIKLLSNTFVKINEVYNSYDFYLLFNNISCILYNFLVNRNSVKKYKDTYIYILNDLSFVYKYIKNNDRTKKKKNFFLLSSSMKELICKNILSVSNRYIKHLHEEDNFDQKDQYVCSLTFLNNLFFDKIIHFHYIYNLWCHVYKTYNYFKCNKLINEDIISLLLLTCSKFQYFIENNSNDRYCRKELIHLKYNIIDDLIKNYLNTYKSISIDNISKIFISLSNSKYTCEVNENLLLESLQSEFEKVTKTSKKGGIHMMDNNLLDNNNSCEKYEHRYIEYKKENLFINLNKIIECLIKLNIFLYLKKKKTYLYLYKQSLCPINLKENILKKILYIANNLYMYEMYGYVCEMLERVLSSHKEQNLFSYNYNKNVEHKMFDKILCHISEDDYIEMSNTMYVLFYDYLKNINSERQSNILRNNSTNDRFIDEIKEKKYKLNNNTLIKHNNVKLNYEKSNNSNGNISNILKDDKNKNHNNVEMDLIDNKNENKKIQEKGQNGENCENCKDVLVNDIINIFGFLKMEKKKFLFFQLYMYLCNITKFKRRYVSSFSLFHMDVFKIIKDMNLKYLCLENYKIKNEECAFLYTIDIVLFKER